MHGSYSVTRGQILRVGPKGPKYFRSMTEGELNDRNDIFLPMYYALFFLGTSNKTNEKPPVIPKPNMQCRRAGKILLKTQVTP